MGSKSDMATMEKAGAGARGARHPQRDPRDVRAPRPRHRRRLLPNAHMRGLKVIIAGAGLSAALPGVAAAHTDLPVIGVPLTARPRRPAGSTRCSRSPRCRRACPWPASGRQRAQRRGAGGAHPRALWLPSARDLALHPPRDGRASGPTRPAFETWRRGRGRRRRGARRARRRRTSRRSAARPSRSRRSPSASGSPTTTSPRSSTCSPRRAGPAGRWIHFGLTSSDVLDTALALQLRAGRARCRRRRARARRSARRRRRASTRHAVRRAHARRARRADDVRHQARRLRLRGAAQRRAARARVRAGGGRRDLGRGRHVRGARRPSSRRACSTRLGPARASRSRRRSCRATATPSCCRRSRWPGAGLERFATEIRHLQRTEVREVEEPFRAGQQKGSSAMPHKRNPITTERITGLARVLRGYAQAGVENVALWHERDISHSGAERVVLPDATILLDYMQALATGSCAGMVVHAERMRRNLDLTHGALFSQRVLLALVGGRDEPRRGLPHRPGVGPAGLGHRHAAARADRGRGRTGGGARPRRALRLRLVLRHADTVSGASTRSRSAAACGRRPRC